MIQELTRTTNFVLTHPLGRRTKLRSLTKLALWQARSRLFSGPHKISFVNQTQLWAQKGEAGVTGNIYVGLHEFSDMAFVAHMLRKGDLFADVGANAGSYSVLAAGVTGARTVAIEPVPSTLKRLEKNITLNGLEHLVTIWGCALTAHAGFVEMITDADSTNQIIRNYSAKKRVSAPDNITTVPALSADEIFENEKPIAAKIDVEGHEASLFEGADALISSPDLKALIVELSARGGEAVVALLESSGFMSVEYHPFERRLTEALPTFNSGNTLFIRTNDWKFISDRLARAESISTQGLTI